MMSRPGWEGGLRGRVYALGRRLTPLGLRRALRRRVRTEALLGIHKPPPEIAWGPLDPGWARPGIEDVLVLPVVAWSYRRQRPQQLAEALARRGRRVFYGSVEGEGEPREPVAAAPGVTLLPIEGVRREDLPSRRLSGRALEAAFAGLTRAREHYSLERTALLVQTPFWQPLAAAARERFGWRVLYDCLDAHTEFRTNRRRVLAEAEQALASGADIAIATSEILRRRMAKWNPSSRLLPNACDFRLFDDVPPRAASGGALTVGYAGAVDAWFDMKLLSRLARLRPEWRFEIVGGFEGRWWSQPRSRGNLVFHGERPHAEMPSFRARFDVEIIPFHLTALTHATDPVKLYEAAAAGRPVVATPMESLRPFARMGIVRLAATADEFAREIAAAAAERTAAGARQRAFARENTWDIRAAALDSWIVNLPPLDPERGEGRHGPPPLAGVRRSA